MPKINTMYAFVVSTDDPGDPEGESIVGMLTPQTGVIVPLVIHDMAKLAATREMAQKISNSFGKNITMVRFTQREEEGVITPELIQ